MSVSSTRQHEILYASNSSPQILINDGKLNAQNAFVIFHGADDTNCHQTYILTDMNITKLSPVPFIIKRISTQGVFTTSMQNFRILAAGTFFTESTCTTIQTTDYVSIGCNGSEIFRIKDIPQSCDIVNHVVPSLAKTFIPYEVPNIVFKCVNDPIALSYSHIQDMNGLVLWVQDLHDKAIRYWSTSNWKPFNNVEKISDIGIADLWAGFADIAQTRLRVLAVHIMTYDAKTKTVEIDDFLNIEIMGGIANLPYRLLPKSSWIIRINMSLHFDINAISTHLTPGPEQVYDDELPPYTPSAPTINERLASVLFVPDVKPYPFKAIDTNKIEVQRTAKCDYFYKTLGSNIRDYGRVTVVLHTPQVSVSSDRDFVVQDTRFCMFSDLNQYDASFLDDAYIVYSGEELRLN